MTLTLKLDASAFWVNTQTVTLNKLLGTPGGTVVSATVVGRAFQGIPRQAERQATAGAYQGSEVVWRLPVSFLGAVVPLPADQVVDPLGVVYAVVWVHYAAVTQEYRCFAVNLAVYLPDQVTVERPTYSQDQYHLDTPTWTPVYAAVSARVQPVAFDPTVEEAVAGQVLRYDVVLSQQVTLQPGDRVNWLGVLYSIESYTNALRIGDFPSLRMRSTN